MPISCTHPLTFVLDSHGQNGRSAGVHHNRKRNNEEECEDEIEDEGQMETAEEEEAAAEKRKRKSKPLQIPLSNITKFK